MTKKYYILRFERTDDLHAAGEKVFNADNPLHIGQTEACELRLTNDSQYEDAVLAVIEKTTDENGWKLIRLSPFKEHEVRVNGMPINYVHYLVDGDRIAFEGQRQELTFSIREDDKYTTSNILSTRKSSNRTVVAWLAVISVALIAFVLYQLHSSPMSERMIEKAKQSVFQIMVDSIELRVHSGDSTSVIQTARLHDEYGIAFLTTDGKLVTARHCLEPWLNVAATTPMNTDPNSGTPLPVRMALQAVTNNIIAENEDNDTRWEMISYCTLLKPGTNDTVLTVTSADFVIDDSRDHIMEYGDFENQYFWRSIKVRPHRTDMMLGDIAYLPDAASRMHMKGNIRMATKEEVRALCKKNNRPLVIIGRMSNDTESQQLQSPTAHLMLQITDEDCKEGYPNIVIAHDGKIGHGFSGGPVLTRTGFFDWCVIGVVSVTDQNNEGWYYSVPISEIERMENTK